jgi:hypothetical protein
MLNRRNIVLLGVLGAAAAIARARAADASAQAFIAAIYNAYKGKSGNGISLDSDAIIRRYFEPALAARMIKDRKDAADRGEAPTLSGDPFVDSGEWDIEEIESPWRARALKRSILPEFRQAQDHRARARQAERGLADRRHHLAAGRRDGNAARVVHRAVRDAGRE